MTRVILAFGIALVLAGPAAAQVPGTPANVNDCTLIQDPVELRNCILRFEGNRTPLPTTLETPSQGALPREAEDGLPEPGETPAPRVPARARVAPQGIAGPGPTGRTGATDRPTAAKATEPERPRPNPRDTITSIEQVVVPNASRRGGF